MDYALAILFPHPKFERFFAFAFMCCVMSLR